MSYRIRKGIPLPEKSSNAIYPFSDMEIGDSFTFESDSIAKIEQAAYQYARRVGGGVKFSVRKLDDDRAGIWRVE